MTPAEKTEFGRALAQLFAVYNEELTAKVLDAWWGLFHQCSLDEVKAAMNAHAQDPDAGVYTPRPAHITNRMRHIRELQHQALLALRAEMYDKLQEIDAKKRMAANDVKLGLIHPEAATARIEHLDAMRRNVLAMPQYRIVHEQRRLGNL